MEITAYELAHRWLGIREVPGGASNPFVLGMLQLEDPLVADDATPWCSAFVNFIAWQLMLPRSGSLAARSWLGVGTPVALDDARTGFDVVILSRGALPQPGPHVLGAPGHVGFYAGGVLSAPTKIVVLGGNQGDEVSTEIFDRARVLGVRRLLVT